MSEALYERCLYWGGPRGGIAKIRGHTVRLSSPPEICGVRIVGLEYMPDVSVARLQPYASGWRDMNEHEVRAADAVLGALGPE